MKDGAADNRTSGGDLETSRVGKCATPESANAAEVGQRGPTDGREPRATAVERRDVSHEGAASRGADPARQREWLEMLLPGDGEAARRARAVALLDALHGWVTPGPSPAAPVDLERARALVHAADVDEATRLIDVLLAATAGVVVPGDSFASWPRPSAAARLAWSKLATTVGRLVGVPAPPAPAESAESVASRLHAWLERHAPVAAEAWGVRLRWAVEGAGVALEHWERRYGRGTLGARPFAQRVASLVDGVELCLDRGRVERARELLSGHKTEVSIDARLVRLTGWCELLAGQMSESRAWLAEASNERLPLPLPLVALRRRAPFVAPLLEARTGAMLENSAARRTPPTDGERREINASLLALLTRRRGDGALVVVHVEGVTGQLAARAARALVDVNEVARERVERALLSGAPQFDFPEPREPSDRPRAAVAVPLPADGPRGVVWLEFEHRLVPTDERLRQFAAAAALRCLHRFDAPAPQGLVAGDQVAETAGRHGHADAAVRWPSIWERTDVASATERDGDGGTALGGGAASDVAASDSAASDSAASDSAAIDSAAIDSAASDAVADVESATARADAVFGRSTAPKLQLDGGAVPPTVSRAPSVESSAPRTTQKSRATFVRSAEVREHPHHRVAHGSTRLEPLAGLEHSDPRRRLAADLAQLLPETWLARPWWLIAPHNGVFEVWGARTPAPLLLDGARERHLSAVLSTGDARLEDSVDAALRLDPECRCRASLPLLVDGRCVALFVVEATRRGELSVGTLQQVAARLRNRGRDVLWARLARRHRERFGEVLVGDAFALVDPARPFELAEYHELGVVGPRGSGKAHLARCVYLFGGARGTFEEWRASHLRSGWERELDERSGAVLVRRIDRADPQVQTQFADWLGRRAAARSGPRVSWTAVTDELVPTLQQRAHLRLAPLTERRDRLPRLAQALHERAADAAGVPATRLDESALATLWRAPWRGGVAELDRLLTTLVQRCTRPNVGATDVEAAARELGVELVRRLSTRRPSRRLLEQALATTCLPSGRANQRRAALYLGWDRDTLRLRLTEAHMLGERGDDTTSKGRGGAVLRSEPDPDPA